MDKTVSVIIPAYNAAATVARAIDSCLTQTRVPLEIIVVDDGSTDDTAAVVANFPAPVRLLRKANGGPASARNLGARLARGDWLAMLDADDWWFPWKLERQLSLDQSADIGLISAHWDNCAFEMPTDVTFDRLWDANCIANSCVLIRRTAFEQLGGFDESRDLISVEDYNLWLTIAAAGLKIVIYPEVLTHYERGTGLSSNIERFFEASLANAEAVAKKLGLPDRQLHDKRQSIYERFGREALYRRHERLARSLLLKAVAGKPTISNVTGLCASYLPPAILNARRYFVGQLLGGDSADPVREIPTATPIHFGESGPYLLIIIDAEEEFDWSKLPSSSMSVKSMQAQSLAQRIFERFRIVPT
jgi:glycosyltransferase involved in cell wall biosynthesis